MPKAQVSDILLSIGQDFTRLGSLLANNKAELLATTTNTKSPYHPPRNVSRGIFMPPSEILPHTSTLAIRTENV
ncbi:unnamed protein product [Absidia cylindrospora]